MQRTTHRFLFLTCELLLTTLLTYSLTDSFLLASVSFGNFHFHNKYKIPNGLPLIYDIQSKCVKLLDDGTGRDPLEVYNFGPAAKYLFRPCQNEDGSIDEECTIQYDSEITTTNEDQDTLDYIKKQLGR